MTPTRAMKKQSSAKTSGTRAPGGAEERASERFLEKDLEAVSTEFELKRAIEAYIPILQASYAFAGGDANPPMPTGYRVVARIETRAEEAVMTPEEANAVGVDMRAMGLGGGAEESLEGIPNPERFGFVVREEATGALIVSIRGTQTPREWVKNFTAIPNPFSAVRGFGLVHLGFEQMWRSIRRDVLAALEGEAEERRITLLGHSLGGAMATLGTVDIKKNLKRPNVDLWTVGCPRAGKVVFRVKFNKLIEKCIRVTETRDIVPHVPSMLTAWNHVGKQVEVRSKVENAHSLESYLEGLEALSGNEAVGVEMVTAARGL